MNVMMIIHISYYDDGDEDEDIDDTGDEDEDVDDTGDEDEDEDVDDVGGEGDTKQPLSLHARASTAKPENILS